MIRGLIFDFDGLIVDTEWSVYQSWVEMFDSFDAELPLDLWKTIIGTSEIEHFDPFELLESQVNQNLDIKDLQKERHDREMELVLTQPILPGVEEKLRTAKTQKLKLAIASSSDRAWVEGNLTRLGLFENFDVVHTSDDVERTKPDPALYRLALRSLGLSPTEAIVFEDSSNGVWAAKEAGIFTVAVPNRLTANLDLNRADMVLDSLSALSLADMILAAEGQIST